MPTLDALIPLLRQAAREELLPRFQQHGYQQKADGSLVTEADLAMQQRLSRELNRDYPAIPLLGEEAEAAEQQALLDEMGAEGLWVLDPLDGTSNFAAGFPFFAVSLALLDAQGVRLGVIYDPIHDECFTAERGQGACLNGQPLGTQKPATPLAKGIGLIDFKRLPAALTQRLLSEPLYASQRSLGSVVLDWCWVAAGRVHVYLHGKQKLWDYAAASLVLAEAGGQAQTLDGEPVFQASLNGRSAVAALDKAIFEQWCAYLQTHLTQTAQPI